tara:strand:- start:1365 stop:1589 length:225 start_codon:yes stop_codon:yes gene_type:complete
MIIEGHFNKTEIKAANNYKAIVVSLKNGTCKLQFPSAEMYEAWLAEQRQLNPKQWMHYLKIKKEMVAAMVKKLK